MLLENTKPLGSKLLLSILIAVSFSGGNSLWSQDVGTSLSGSSNGRTSQIWDYDGRHILGCVGRVVYMWDAESGAVLQMFAGHKEEINSVQFSPGSKYVLTSSWVHGADTPLPSDDTSTRLWATENGKAVYTLSGQFALKFSQDASTFLTVSTNGTNDRFTNLNLIDTSSGKRRIGVLPAPGVGWAAIGSGGTSFVSGGTLFDVASGRKLGSVGTMSFNSYGKDGAFAYLGKTGFEVISPQGMIVQKIPYQTDKPSYNSQWTADGTKVVGDAWPEQYGKKCQMRIWNVDQGQDIVPSPCPKDVFSSSIRISPDGRRFMASIGNHAKLGMWDLQTGREIWEIAYPIGLQGFSPDSKTFIAIAAVEPKINVQGAPHYVIYNSDSGKVVLNGSLQGYQDK